MITTFEEIKKEYFLKSMESTLRIPILLYDNRQQAFSQLGLQESDIFIHLLWASNPGLLC